MELKKIFVFSVMCNMILMSAIAGTNSLKTTDSEMEKRVDKLLKRLTLEEKVGQMTQYTLDVVGRKANQNESVDPFEFDTERLDSFMLKMKVGSILNTSNNKAQSLESWSVIVSTLQKKALQATGIPLLYGIDAIHGTNYTAGATLFPQQIGMAATFNRDLMKEGSRISAYETRASNIPYTFAPVLDLGRDARWPRIWETFGEDPYLASQMGLASVLGFQGENHNRIDRFHVAASLKHFMGYGVPVYGRDRTPSVITEADLREKHFEPFLHSVKAGALSIMINSGVVNGVSTHADYRLLTHWLKNDLKYDGVLITDWNDVENLSNRDRIEAEFKSAVARSINAGIDLVMVPYRPDFTRLLIDLVNEGKVSHKRIDDAVRRVLRMKMRLGLFENPYWDYKSYTEFGSRAHESAAKAAADEAIVLLKNENNTLPLKKGSRILVTGPNANSMRPMNGGWSYSWQGEKTEMFAEKYNTFYEAIRNKFGADKVRFVQGLEYNMHGAYHEEQNLSIDATLRAAREVDYIVVVVGENTYCESPGNLDELSLSDNQLALVTALQTTNKPLILVLNAGRPRLIRKIEPLSHAILQTMLPGNFGGDALADILCGDVNPSAKLPYTYPKFEQGLITYDYKPSQNIDGKMDGVYDYGAQTSVQYPFGFGLSYTSFAYSNLTVDKQQFVSGDVITVSVDVKNTGAVKGKEAVLLFSRDMVASITPDIRRLRAFEKIELNPGETKTVSFELKADDLAFVNENGRWTLEQGEFMLQVGNAYAKIICNKTRIWSSPNR
jgi:beta-glucosidase